ncbi:hypothetical protein [Caedibacter taeniospiralis]|jgi:hypothetical protein|uniref:hypothetical protein n=1 Tax=Caedibacter taeniospiralis TaxID=28907 RepID=UPI0037C17FA9
MKKILAHINTGLQENNLKKVMELLVQLAMKIHQEHPESASLDGVHKLMKDIISEDTENASKKNSDHETTELRSRYSNAPTLDNTMVTKSMGGVQEDINPGNACKILNAIESAMQDRTESVVSTMTDNNPTNTLEYLKFMRLGLTAYIGTIDQNINDFNVGNEEYVKQAGTILTSDLEAETLKFALNQAIYLLREVPLSQEAFDQYAFAKQKESKNRTQPALRAEQRICLDSIVPGATKEQFGNFLKAIKDQGIKDLAGLNKWIESDQLNNEEFHTKYGVDKSSVNFSPKHTNGIKIQKLNQLKDTLEKDRDSCGLQQVISQAINPLLGAAFSADAQDQVISELEKLKEVIATTHTLCKGAKEGLDDHQKQAIDQHERNVLKSTTSLFANKIKGQISDTQKEQYIDEIKTSENECTKIVDNTTSRKFLCALTNFLSHIAVVGMIANVVNKCMTGEWLFYNHSEQSKAIQCADRDIALTALR